jgi:chitinase
MADKSFQRRAPRGISIFSFGLLLAVVIYFYRQIKTGDSLESIIARDSLDLNFADRSDYPTNVTLDKRQDTFNCGPSNPCSNGACCGGNGYCGYGED